MFISDGFLTKLSFGTMLSEKNPSGCPEFCLTDVTNNIPTKVLAWNVHREFLTTVIHREFPTKVYHSEFPTKFQTTNFSKKFMTMNFGREFSKMSVFPYGKLRSVIPDRLLPSEIPGHQLPLGNSWPPTSVEKLKYFFKKYLIYLFLYNINTKNYLKY